MAADRATEARQRAERVLAQTDIPGFPLWKPWGFDLAEDVLWVLDERERLTEAARYALDCIESPSQPHECADGEDVYDARMMSRAATRLRAVLSAGQRKPEAV